MQPLLPPTALANHPPTIVYQVYLIASKSTYLPQLSPTLRLPPVYTYSAHACDTRRYHYHTTPLEGCFQYLPFETRHAYCPSRRFETPWRENLTLVGDLAANRTRDVHATRHPALEQTTLAGFLRCQTYRREKQKKV